MKINESKTILMKFNFSKLKDFPPELHIEGFNNLLQVIKETRLLGVMVTDGLKWEANTRFICETGYKRLWTLRRMKNLKMGRHNIIDVYIKEIRSILELASPVWHSGLTLSQSADIERIQRIAVKIILSDPHSGRCELSYRAANS